MLSYSRAHVVDRVLLRTLADVVTRDRATTAEMLALIAEVERRRLYAGAGFESMYAYCVRHLNMSEDVAYKRIRTARISRRFPGVLELIPQGQLNLTTIVCLAPHLRRMSKKAGDELLGAAVGKTRAELELFLAERFPKTDLPEGIQPLPAARADIELAPGPVHDTGMTPVAETSPGLADSVRVASPPSPMSVRPSSPASTAPVPRVTPLSPGRFGVQLTVSQGTHDKLRYAQSLLAHAVPSGDLEQVLDRALDALIANLERLKFAGTSKPRTARGTSNPRHIPSDVKREVWNRDEGRCTYRSADGHRCEARKLLEYDHEQPLARGGQTSVANLRLRCRAHNQLEAERVFGAGFMEEKRQRGSTSREVN